MKRLTINSYSQSFMALAMVAVVFPLLVATSAHAQLRESSDREEINEFMDKRAWCHPLYFHLSEESQNATEAAAYVSSLDPSAASYEFGRVMLEARLQRSANNVSNYREAILLKSEECLQNYIQLGINLDRIKLHNSYLLRLKIVAKKAEETLSMGLSAHKNNFWRQFEEIYIYGKGLILVADLYDYLGRSITNANTMLSFYEKSKSLIHEQYSSEIFDHYLAYDKGWIGEVRNSVNEASRLRSQIVSFAPVIFLQGRQGHALRLNVEAPLKTYQGSFTTLYQQVICPYCEGLETDKFSQITTYHSLAMRTKSFAAAAVQSFENVSIEPVKHWSVQPQREFKRNKAIFAQLFSYSDQIKKKKNLASAFLQGLYNQLWITSIELEQAVLESKSLEHIGKNISSFEKRLSSDKKLGTKWYDYFYSSLVTPTWLELDLPAHDLVSPTQMSVKYGEFAKKLSAWD